MRNNIFIGLVMVLVVFSGCSSKYQVNPDTRGYHISKEEQAFGEKQKIAKKLKMQYDRGFDAGYNKAKEEIKKLIPYLEGLRASAELKDHKGLCLPPLFLDKSDGINIKLIVGKAHICNNFTLNNVFSIVKDGIPGLPDYVVKKTVIDGTNREYTGNFFPTNISIDGVKKTKKFLEKPKSVKISTVKVKNTFTNRKILRKSDYKVSEVKMENDYLLIQFVNKEDQNKFCSTYKICEG